MEDEQVLENETKDYPLNNDSNSHKKMLLDAINKQLQGLTTIFRKVHQSRKKNQQIK